MTSLSRLYVWPSLVLGVCALLAPVVSGEQSEKAPLQQETPDFTVTDVQTNVHWQTANVDNERFQRQFATTLERLGRSMKADLYVKQWLPTVNYAVLHCERASGGSMNDRVPRQPRRQHR